MRTALVLSATIIAAAINPEIHVPKITGILLVAASALLSYMDLYEFFNRRPK